MISTKYPPHSGYFEALRQWGTTVGERTLGPFTIGFASSLILLANISFYEVVAPSLPYPIISIPICLLITLNICMHYYYAVTIPPGFLDDPPRDPVDSFLWAPKVKAKGKEPIRLRGTAWSEKGVKITPGCPNSCRTCQKFRPERSHHCRICKTCVLKYDHHCPVRINGCVGLHNERHFFMFLVYFTLGAGAVAIFGLELFNHALILSAGILFRKWPYHVPCSLFVVVYMIAVFCGCLVAVLLTNLLYEIMYGQTGQESLQNVEYSQEATERDEEFVNSYDCGKWKNLQLFFNIGEGGYSGLSLILPLRVEPYTDGFSWARKAGYEKHPSFRKAQADQSIMAKLYKLTGLN